MGTCVNYLAAHQPRDQEFNPVIPPPFHSERFIAKAYAKRFPMLPPRVHPMLRPRMASCHRPLSRVYSDDTIHKRQEPVAHLFVSASPYMLSKLVVELRLYSRLYPSFHGSPCPLDGICVGACNRVLEIQTMDNLQMCEAFLRRAIVRFPAVWKLW